MHSEQQPFFMKFHSKMNLFNLIKCKLNQELWNNLIVDVEQDKWENVFTEALPIFAKQRGCRLKTP